MKLHIDRNSSEGLSKQISEQIRSKIRSGELQIGHKLPSTRILSSDIGVNRITVSQAYKTLIFEGLLRSGVGSGTYVSDQNRSEKTKLDRSNYNPILAKGVHALWRQQTDSFSINRPAPIEVDFATLMPDEKFFPVQAFKECLGKAIEGEGARALQYCGTQGYPPLRETIYERMKRIGAASTPDEILVVNGAQQGIDLVSRCFLSPGDKVALSVPTYHNIFTVLSLLQAEAAPVAPTDRGPDLGSLEKTVSDGSVRLLYVMPNFQNPTGVTCDAACRDGIYAIASKADLPILEDDFERDLALVDTMPEPIKALDKDGRVIYLGTFSKSLFPGLRIGWLVASREMVKVLCAVKKAMDLENSALMQAATHRFCRQGYYDEHIARMRGILNERMETALNTLEARMPPGTSWSRPLGGYALWISLPGGIRSEAVYEEAGKKGVAVSPGTLFSGGGDDPGGIRLSLSRTDPGEIRRGIAILAEVIEEQHRSKDQKVASLAKAPQHL